MQGWAVDQVFVPSGHLQYMRHGQSPCPHSHALGLRGHTLCPVQMGSQAPWILYCIQSMR